MTKPSKYFIGVDVGTGSARAGIFNVSGDRIAMATCPIRMWRPHPEWAEQSSENIWEAVGEAVRQAISEGDVAPEAVAGIGFDATCSLVVLDTQDRPLTVSPDGDPSRNVIVWMDHRALAETEEINRGSHDVLKYVGGALSPEMETPKLLWLKRNLRSTWSQAGKFLDLADFLVYRSTGLEIRSLCTSVCKWTYLGHESRWDRDFFAHIGLDDLLGTRVGDDVREIGAPAGPLTDAAAQHLGLTTQTQVGVGIIDAHAGGVGLLGAAWEPQDSLNREKLETALAIIGGTSSCHMAVSREPNFIPGIWGPYFGAMVPGMWLTEGGQSATGALIDYVLSNHAASSELAEIAHADGTTIYEAANKKLLQMAAAAGLSDPTTLTRDVHVLDYHLGNRSPIGDPRARGLIDGLSLDLSLESLVLQYLATLQSVAYGTRAIIDAMNANGYDIRQIFVVGGGTKNPLWLQQHADSTGATLVLPHEPEAVLLGSAILAATASGAYPDAASAMAAMCKSGGQVHPDTEMRSFHDAKYACYRELYDQQLARRKRMAEAV